MHTALPAMAHVGRHYSDSNQATPRFPVCGVVPFADAARAQEVPPGLEEWTEWGSAAELRKSLRSRSDNTALSEQPWLANLRELLDKLASGELRAFVVDVDRHVTEVPREAWTCGSAVRILLHGGFGSATPLESECDEADFVEAVSQAWQGTGGKPLFVEEPAVREERDADTFGGRGAVEHDRSESDKRSPSKRDVSQREAIDRAIEDKFGRSSGRGAGPPELRMAMARFVLEGTEENPEVPRSKLLANFTFPGWKVSCSKGRPYLQEIEKGTTITASTVARWCSDVKKILRTSSHR